MRPLLYALIFGLDAARRAFPPRVLEVLVAAGVLLYGGTGVATMLLGGNIMTYGNGAWGVLAQSIGGGGGKTLIRRIWSTRWFIIIWTTLCPTGTQFSTRICNCYNRIRLDGITRDNSTHRLCRKVH